MRARKNSGRSGGLNLGHVQTTTGAATIGSAAAGSLANGTTTNIGAGFAAAPPVGGISTGLGQMAGERGLTYVPANAGEYISGRLAGAASLVSGRFAMIENGLGFQLVPWQPILEKRIGQHITGLQRDDGGIEWTLGRSRGLSR